MILISPNFVDNLWLQTNFQFISRPMTTVTNAPTKPLRQVVKDETVKGQKISKGKFWCFHFSKEATIFFLISAPK